MKRYPWSLLIIMLLNGYQEEDKGVDIFYKGSRLSEFFYAEKGKIANN